MRGEVERGAKSHGLRPVKNCRANLNGCLRGRGWLGLVLITRNENRGEDKGCVGFSRDVNALR